MLSRSYRQSWKERNDNRKFCLPSINFTAVHRELGSRGERPDRRKLQTDDGRGLPRRTLLAGVVTD
jgi:hypothetical protein